METFSFEEENQHCEPIGDCCDPIHWSYEKLYPDQIILHDNIRPFDFEFIETLAVSLHEQGQIQACIGDVVLSDDVQRVRIFAGQHRWAAMRMLFEYNEYKQVTVRVADRTLSAREIMELQMSENLQNKMTPAQDAVVIADLWKTFFCLDNNHSRRELAAKIGRSYETVCKAIRYVGEINPKVQRMVDEGVMSYSVALTLLSVPPTKEGYIFDKQLQYAIYFVAHEFSVQKAKKYLNDLDEKARDNNGTLFDPDFWCDLDEKIRKVTMRDKIDRMGGEALGWFARITRLVELLEDPYRIELSEGLQERVVELRRALAKFDKDLPQYRES